MTKSLNITLQANSNYTMGSIVEIMVMISNNGEEVVNIYKPANLNGFLRYDLFTVETFGNIKDYHGAVFFPTKKSFLDLEPSQSFGFNVSLAKEYLLDESGNYRIELNQKKLLHNPLQYVNVSCSNLDFDFFITDQPPISTYVEVSQKLSKSNIKCESFGNQHCIYNAKSIKELNETQEAHFSAKKFLEYTKNNIFNPLPAYIKSAYDTMFCKNNYSEINNLQSKLQVMEDYMESDMNYWLRAKDCDPGDFGYIYPAQPQKNIYFCSLYESAKVVPDSSKNHDSKAGVIIHEVSHKAVNTLDHFYSYTNCETQALICNPKTITNADCLQIFVELVALQQNASLHDEL